MKTQAKTLKVRVKDKHSKMLSRLAFGVNQVWNASNDLTHEAYGMLTEYIEVNEAYTTQTCSSCGCIGRNSPKGMNGLGIRE